jgi:hypothetical protein|tara:strand:+ start:1083 stop:1394 length:312 start_codon:yes stop_codon:yes gene_type:complete
MTILATPVTRACEYAKKPLSYIMTPCNKREAVEARWAFWFYLVIEEGWSLTRSARRIKYDHTTVLYGLRKYAAEHLGTDPKATLEDIRQAAQAPLLKLMEEAA